MPLACRLPPEPETVISPKSTLPGAPALGDHCLPSYSQSSPNMEGMQKGILGRSSVNLIPLACRVSVQYTPEPTAMISPESPLLGTSWGGGGNNLAQLSPILPILGGQLEESLTSLAHGEAFYIITNLTKLTSLVNRKVHDLCDPTNREPGWALVSLVCAHP